jgi:hypothetical protein
MEAASATRIRADYGGLTLRTRARSSGSAACHTPGCRHRALDGRVFCAGCQATLDRVREELRAAGPGGRKPRVRKAA